MDALLLALHLCATAAMVGLIWFVQIVHYPLFSMVGVDGFAAYEREHQRRTSYVVGPPMAIEGVSALALFAWPPSDLGRWLPFVGLVLLAVVHASTVFLQVPTHGKLGEGFTRESAERLVRTNWIRTLAWSARGALAIALVSLA